MSSFWNNYRVFREHMRGKPLSVVRNKKKNLQQLPFGIGPLVSFALSEMQKNEPDKWAKLMKDLGK